MNIKTEGEKSSTIPRVHFSTKRQISPFPSTYSTPAAPMMIFFQHVRALLTLQFFKHYHALGKKRLWLSSPFSPSTRKLSVAGSTPFLSKFQLLENNLQNELQITDGWSVRLEESGASLSRSSDSSIWETEWRQMVLKASGCTQWKSLLDDRANCLLAWTAVMCTESTDISVVNYEFIKSLLIRIH